MNARVLPDLTAMQAEIDRLRLENEKLKQGRQFRLKVSEKGALSAYGMGRFPVTLYASQWMALIDKVDDIVAFIDEHKDELSWKE